MPMAQFIVESSVLVLNGTVHSEFTVTIPLLYTLVYIFRMMTATLPAC
jgi:hypothetical protein